MDRTSVDWQGPMTAIVTPFDAAGRLDEAAFGAVVERQIVDGVTGVIVGGCTGEFWAQSLEERKRLHALCVSTVAGRVPVIAGTSMVRTSETIELTAHAKSVGCDGAMVMPPWFVKLPGEDIVAHFRAVSDAVKLPLMAYNIPSGNVNPLTPALVDRLADLDTVVAIKESSFDYRNFYHTITRVKDRLRVFGPLSQFGYAALILGASGSAGILHHIWGRHPTDLHDACVRGDLATALALQQTAEALLELLSANGRNMYASLKAGMQLLGLPGGLPRPPLQPLGAKERRELADGMRALAITLPAAA
jgi:dihydrodipicolinate synthase/N-acetylneuraminate lyase